LPPNDGGNTSCSSCGNNESFSKDGEDGGPMAPRIALRSYNRLNKRLVHVTMEVYPPVQVV
jgi:hypothetical protein